MPVSVAASLSGYIEKLEFEQIPSEVIQYLKLLMTDALACMISGGETEPSGIMLDIFEEMGGKEEVTVPAAGRRFPLFHGIYLNSAFANALDFDDNNPLCTAGHPSATVFPAALAYAERNGASGKSLMTALVAGYETMLRIGKAVEPTCRRMMEVNGYSTQQIFGAMAAAGKLLGLTREKLTWAYGIAGLTAPVPGVRKEGLDYRERPAGWVKNNYGWAAMGGALSAEMAARGFVGCPYIFDGDKGFWIMAGSDRCQPEWFTYELGKQYLLLEIGFKPYACCRWTHAAVEAAEELAAERPFTRQEIKAVRVLTFEEPYYNLRDPKPKNLLDAQFSLPHTVALALLGRSPAKGLNAENLMDTDICTLASSIEIILDEEASKAYCDPVKSRQYATVEVELRSGEVLRREVRLARGDSQRPLKKEEILQKYETLTEPIIGRQGASRLLKAIWSMEEVENLCDFFRN